MAYLMSGFGSDSNASLTNQVILDTVISFNGFTWIRYYFFQRYPWIPLFLSSRHFYSGASNDLSLVIILMGLRYVRLERGTVKQGTCSACFGPGDRAARSS